MNLSDPHRRLAKKLVEKGLGTPAIFVLETMKPFSVVAQQTLFAASPLAILGNFQNTHRELAQLFESRENLEELLLELERLIEEDSDER